jgi:hypothetical protein
MKSKFSFQAFLPIIIAIVTFLVADFGYFSPLLNGQTLSMHDIEMASGAAQELKDFHDKTGEWAWWTNSMFGGMPAYMIVGEYSYSLASNFGSFIYGLFPNPANLFFLAMCCFYLLMRVLKINNWISIAASIAYAFGTYNLVFVEAGHISKILALAYLPGLLAGIMVVFRKHYILGSFLTALFLGLELQANHLQITYYFLFVVLIYVAFELINIIKKKDFIAIPKIAMAFAIALIIGVGMHTQRLWSVLTYSQETIRGQSELKETSVGKSGLDKEYAFSWSYGITETINMMIPNLMGGGSVGALDQNSETYKLITQKGVDRTSAQRFISALPLYHGDQSSTAGPAYSGVIMFFLFILSLFILKTNWRWFHLGALLFLIMLSWGSNLPSLNYLLFDYLPGYNKFRAVSIILTVAHFVLVWGAAVSLNRLLDKEITFEFLKKPILYSNGIMLGLMVLGYLGIDLIGNSDAAFLNNLKPSFGDDLANQVLNALRDDRASIALGDIYRAIGFVLVAILLIYLFTKQKINTTFFTLAFLVIIVFDMFSVGKRYFNNADFSPKFKSNAPMFEPTTADLQIQQDKDPNFRVINLTVSFMSDARDSYFHKSLGGYHGAKLKKYQELVENQMIKDGRLNMGVINMLNTKYFINNTPEGPQAQLNPDALGNAWFVDTLISVPNADEELELTGTVNTGNKAVTQAHYLKTTKYFNNSENAKVDLVSYEPNKLVYKSTNESPSFAVFSEIFYRGNKDWISYLDGVKVEHIKTDYLLRGLEIPEGNHEIVFEFNPRSVYQGEKGDLAASIGLILLGGFALFISFKKETK